jgi:hypothetical protein
MSSSILFSVTDHVDDVSFIYDIMKKVVDGGNVEFEEADRLLDTRLF